MQKRLVTLGLAMLTVGIALGWSISIARAQIVLARPDQVRFRIIGDEPIAAPDGRGFVSTWKAVVVQDQKSAQCYVAFLAGSAMSVTGPSTCP